MIERLILALKKCRRNTDDNGGGGGGRGGSSPLLNYFKVILNFGYVLFLIPFRLETGAISRRCSNGEIDVEGRCYQYGRSRVQLKYNRIHQCICAIVHCLIMFEYFSLARKHVNWFDLFGNGSGGGSTNGNGSAFESLQSVGCIACLVYGVAFICTFWAKRDAWLRAFRLIDEIELVSSSVSLSTSDRDDIDIDGGGGGGGSNDSSSAWIGFKINLLGITLGAMYTTFGLMDTTFEHNFRIIDNNLTSLFANYYAETQELYLFHEDHAPPAPSSVQEHSDFLLHSFTTALTITRLAVAFPKFLLIQVLEWSVLTTVLCLRHVMTNFLKLRPRRINVSSMSNAGTSADISSNSNTQQENHGLFQRIRTEQQLLPDPDRDHESLLIFTHYDHLKELVKTLNSATKVLTFSCIGVALPFYASWIVIVFFEENVEWRQFAHFYFYFGVFFILLVLAAEFNAKSIDFYRWIARAQNSEAYSPSRLSSILIDLQCNEVAVKGSAIFVITYRFIGGFLSVIVTYTIIMLQFQVSRRARSGGGGGQ